MRFGWHLSVRRRLHRRATYERGADEEEDVSGLATHDSPASEAPVGELVSRASEQLTTLVRDEMRLAQSELAQKPAGTMTSKTFRIAAYPSPLN